MLRNSIIILILLLTSCSPQKRLNRLVKKHPELVSTQVITIRDTIKDTISVVTTRVEHDTIFNFLEVHDTLIIQRDNLKIKYFYDTIKQQVYIAGECDTIFLDVPYEVIVEYEVPCDRLLVQEKSDWWIYILIGIGVFILLFLYKHFKK